MTSVSLRLRLTLIILLPLLVIAVAVGAWQLGDARKKAADLFDRSLLSTALAISADVARSDGDAISVETRDRLADTSGGPVFYHVYAPDGVFVIGYATPPVPPPGARVPSEEETSYFNGVFHGRDVRVLKFRDVATVGGYSGVFTYTVWQDVAVRNAFVRDLSTRSFVVISVLIGTVALVVWFGVAIGLRPLLDLEDAISARSSSDLRPIQRRVPVETQGLVQRLNSLFAQVEATFQRQTEFISNAAHQLRNPIAGVLAMAEAVQSAPNADAARERSTELLASARHASDLANKLLTLERIRADDSDLMDAPVDVNALVMEVTDSLAPQAQTRAVTITADPGAFGLIEADAVMVREAIINLADNALRHGGPGLSRIDISVDRPEGAPLRITVADDGQGIKASDVPVVLSRFGQASPGEGSGLGLSIAEAVAERHGGRLELNADGPGLRVSLLFPGASKRDAQRPTA